MKQYLVFSFILCYNVLLAQSVTGQFLKLPDQTIKLEGFNGLKTYHISSAISDTNGNFEVSYSKSDYGVGYLISADRKPLFVILSGEDIEIIGESLSNPETIKIKKGLENQYFEQYSKQHSKREQALSAWVYLEKIYANDTLFLVQKNPVNAIKSEKQRIMVEDQLFLDALPKDSYVKWFLPKRKLVSSVSAVAQFRTKEIQETIQAFRQLDYTDNRLYKSGLFKDAIESHFWLLENSGSPLDKVFEEMKISIDAMLPKLATNENIFNEVTDYLFDLLEKHSLFKASEYLALKVLNEGSCSITDDLANQLEIYRVMKKGNIAADMVFDKFNFVNPKTNLTKLSDVKSKYIVVVFGASWCPKCNEELPEIAKLYAKWKSKGVDVIFIALEDDRNAFIDFAQSFPFPSYSDVKKWDSKIVNDYYVFSTPTMFLLDSDREIILRPNSVNQMDAWVDWN
tara:strand:+ start:1064 stop:2428 length:1365 start_codon:yes stop_codon:yes gene_type:complete